MYRRFAWVPACFVLALVFACSGAQQSGFVGDTDGGPAEGPDGSGGPPHDGSVGPLADAPSLFHDTGVSHEASGSDATLYNDAGLPDVGDAACLMGDAGPAVYTEKCAATTVDECDGATDTYLTSVGVPAGLLNGTQGNGFDDDCDGQVDEGCACPANGITKTCWEVPPSLVDPSTMQPVGWCNPNSKGSLDCAGNEFPHWSGVCRGALPPYPQDVCAPGDFNCDGTPENPPNQNCSCQSVTVTCPSAAITEPPYPPPTTIQLIDGSQWIDANDRAAATNWTWTVIGGDCDNVLPHPTFAIYKQTDSTAAGAKVGARTPVSYNNGASPPRYVSTAGAPLVSIQAPNYGNGVAGGQVYPAFGLSGDYIVQGEWDLHGQHYVCTQKVQVRAPGLRAELCWDSVGGGGLSASGGNDIDLHFAQQKYKGAAPSCALKGWETTCALGATYEDCWYGSESGCRDFSSAPPDWGYAASANSACIGWSSKRSGAGPQFCTNPRLDKDNITCDPTIDDPTNLNFCGPENINLDDPNNGDSFVAAVNHYANHGGTSTAHTHVNLYCDGARVLSVGYNPVTGQTSFPALVTPGSDSTGDYWIAATITYHAGVGGNPATCDVAPIPSHSADSTRDGSTALCVESTASTVYSYQNHQFDERPAVQVDPNGALPTQTAHWCKH
jgi:hypothetical protein